MDTVKLIGVLIGGKKGSAMPFGGFIWTILLTVVVDGVRGLAFLTARLGVEK